MSDLLTRMRSLLDNRPKGFLAVAVDVDDLEALLHAVQQPALSFTARWHVGYWVSSVDAEDYLISKNTHEAPR